MGAGSRGLSTSSKRKLLEAKRLCTAKHSLFDVCTTQGLQVDSFNKIVRLLIVSLGAEQSLGDSQRSLEDYMTDDTKILGTIFIRRGTKVVVVTKEG